MEIAKELKRLGTENIVITGGEPLLQKNLSEVIDGLHSMGLRVTLSTNGMLLRSESNKNILDHVDEIGLPLDGSSEGVNASIRKGSPKSFTYALDAMKYVQENYPNIKLTVRTVLCKKNIDDIENIPQTLIENGVEISCIRWKIYKIVATGQRKGHILDNGDDWLITDEQARQVIAEITEKYPDLSIKYQDASDKLNRYFHIDPTGRMYTIVGDGTEERDLGSIFNEDRVLVLKDTLEQLHNSPDRITDSHHGSDNF